MTTPSKNSECLEERKVKEEKKAQMNNTSLVDGWIKMELHTIPL